MIVYYLGQFPPPFGGVTVKNALLVDELSRHVPIEVIRFRNDSAFKILKTVLSSAKDDLFIVGFGNSDLRRRFVKGLARTRSRALNRTILIGMGGRIGKELLDDGSYARSCSQLLAVCLETEGMVREAKEAGLQNAILLPNCRPRPKKESDVSADDTTRPLRAVFFSKIGKDKGADVVLDIARLTPATEYDFYGSIDRDFEDVFNREVQELANVRYHGIFDSAKDDIKDVLHGYDVHLFPTRWAFEGVPGVLVETKIAGIPSLVSDICYNSEIIEDGISGVIVDGMDASKWAEAIQSIDSDRNLLRKLKQGAAASAFSYYSDACIEPIMELINEKQGT